MEGGAEPEVNLRGSCFCWALMDACHRYGQKQEGARQLRDPHKREQEILAGNEREREPSSPLKTVPLICPVEARSCGRKEERGRGRKAKASGLSQRKLNV